MLGAVAVQNRGPGIPKSRVILRSMVSSGTYAKSPTGFMIDCRAAVEGTMAVGYEIGHGVYQAWWKDRLEQDAGSYRHASISRHRSSEAPVATLQGGMARALTVGHHHISGSRASPDSRRRRITSVIL